MSKNIIIVLLLSFAFNLHAIEMIETDRVCANYPESEQCAKLSEQARAFCADNMEDPRCVNMHYLQKSFCTKQPDLSYCPEYQAKMGEHCADDQGKALCMVEKIHAACEGDRNSDSCINAKKKAKELFCENHPGSIPCL